MDIKESKIKAILEARDLLGGNSALARITGVKPPTASEWAKGKRSIPATKCPAVEQATGGKVMCEHLLPDFDWDYLSRRKQF